MIKQQRKEKLTKMGEIIKFPTRNKLSDKIFNTKEHINEIRRLIGYEDPPDFKILKGGKD
jgi:hypothetical protein